MAKGPTVTLTFAGDASKLKASVKEAESVTSRLDKGISALGHGFAGFAAAGVASNLAVGGALAGVAIGVVGLGVKIAAQSEKVKASFTGLKDHVVKQVTQLAKPFEGALVGIAQKAQATFDRVKPLLGEMFNVSAPYLSTLADGLMGFVEGALPGLKTALTEAKPVITAISDGLKGLGPKLGEMFKNMTGDGGADRAAQSIKTLFEWIGNLLPMIGNLLNFLGQWGPTLIPIAAFVYGIVSAVKLWTAAQALFNVVMAMNPIALVVIAIVALVAAIIWAWNNCETFRNIVKAVWEGIKSAFQSGVDRAKAIFAWFGELPGRISGWFGQVKDGAVNKLSALVGWVRGLPGQILGALGNLGSLLINSGRSLLTGLWDGIQGALGWVKSKISGALSSIRNLFPFSPAKEGPFSGSGYTIHSGRALMTDFGRGMEGVAPDLRSTASAALGGVQGALSGSQAGSGGSGGVMRLEVGRNADSALAALLMQMVRTGQLQLVRA
jgi:phage-related protein